MADRFLFALAQEPYDEAHSRAVIHRVLELGVNFFDTAIGYQSGTSEQYVGRAVRDFAKREDVVVASSILIGC